MKRTYKHRKCEYCDKEFIPLSSGQLYCSPECKLEMKRAYRREALCADIDWLNSKYESLLDKNKKQHGKDYELLRHDYLVTHDYNELNKEIKDNDLTAEKSGHLDAGEDDEAAKGNRKCHDCGRPTYNYRCTPCTAKWKKKHAVSMSDDFEVEA